MTDFRALCAELVAELHRYKVAHPQHEEDLIDRARAALAEAEPIDVGTRKLGDGADNGLLPMIVSATGDPSEPEIERIICSAISGGADYKNEMPREVTLERVTPSGRFYARYLQGPLKVTELAPPAEGEVAEPASITDEQRTAVRDAIASTIGLSAYDCTRVWDAWSVGTMGQDDFALIVENEERIMEITDAAIEAMRQWQPAPSAEGEVAELVKWLGSHATVAEVAGPVEWADKCTRIKALLEQRHPAPVAVSERLPKASSKVLAYYVNELGMGRTICAIWVPAKSRSDDADLGDNDSLEYNEETDGYYWPEGWYETVENWDDLGYIKVNEGEIIYWQPLPDWHATVLSPPAGEVQP